MECLIQARKKQAEYYNKGKKPFPTYQSGEWILLLQKFIESRRINSKLDYRYIGPFQVIKMVGKIFIELDLKREYPKLHPVFNLSLIVPYVGPNELVNQGVKDKLKEKFYRTEEVVNWEMMDGVLDA
jgi:hypothetical protein